MAFDYYLNYWYNWFSFKYIMIKKLSPNYTRGRQGYKPEIIVIHSMAGTLKGTDSWFASRRSGVSAHYGVGNYGEVHQYVLEENKAWANGIVNRPTFKLYKQGVNPNLYTLAIECEGYDLADAPETLIIALLELIKGLCEEYSIPMDRQHIIAHYQIDGIRKPHCPTRDRTLLDKLISRLNKTTDLTKEQKIKEIKRLLDTL